MIRSGLTLFSLILATASIGATTEIVRVWPGYRTAESLTALREYFGAEPPAAIARAARSDTGDRAGYYWLIRTKSEKAIPAATARLEVTRRGQKVHEIKIVTGDGVGLARPRRGPARLASDPPRRSGADRQPSNQLPLEPELNYGRFF